MSRKEKSLGLLCEKFLKLYPMNVNINDQIIVCLDTMAKILDVERRRIYDIVNVLESVEILSRVRKNQYQWHGFAQVLFTLSKLKTLAVKSNFLDYAKYLMANQLTGSSNANNAFMFDYPPSAASSSSSSSSSSLCSGSSSNHEPDNQIHATREEKSLGIMSQKFLMLFLTSEDGLVSISFAARVLLGNTGNDLNEHGRYKTKIRRLYDIANVLSSIGLIKKCSFQTAVNKPAYQYIGPTVEIMREAENVHDFMNTGNPFSNSKHSLFDHFKRNLDLESNIPKFDINTGQLNSKKRSSPTIIMPNESVESEVNPCLPIYPPEITNANQFQPSSNYYQHDSSQFNFQMSQEQLIDNRSNGYQSMFSQTDSASQFNYYSEDLNHLDLNFDHASSSVNFSNQMILNPSQNHFEQLPNVYTLLN